MIRQLETGSSSSSSSSHIQFITPIYVLEPHIIIRLYLGRYLTLRSVSSLNNPQNSENEIFCENYEVDMLKILLVIIIGYIHYA
jgi:uncharacterized membrane protein